MNTQNKKLIVHDRESNEEYNILLTNSTLEYDGKELTPHIHCSEDGFMEVVVGGKTYVAEILSQNQNEYELLLNGVSYNYSIESPFSLDRKKKLALQANESTTIRLKAPMPGKILEVMVKTGDLVKAGDTLLILEAMKMQNAILASTKGVIKKVLVKEGENTSKSDLLIELDTVLVSV